MTTKQVLATVGGSEITREDLNLALMNAPKEQAMQLNTFPGRKYLLNEMIAQEMLYLDAKERGLDQEEPYLEQLEIIKHSLLKQYALTKMFKDITVSEEEMKEYYQSHQDQFITGGAVRAKHILVKNEEEAQKILEELSRQEKDFEAAAKEYSICPSKVKGGDLGYFEKGKMVPEFEDAAFQLEVGKISQPIKTQFGYHIIKIEDKRPSRELPFEQVKQQVGDHLFRSKQNLTYNEHAKHLKEKYEITIHEELLK